MTKTAFRKKYREVARNAAKIIRSYGEAALKSEAFDLESHEDNFLLPRAVVVAACREAAFQFDLKSNRKLSEEIGLLTYP